MLPFWCYFDYAHHQEHVFPTLLCEPQYCTKHSVLPSASQEPPPPQILGALNARDFQDVASTRRADQLTVGASDGSGVVQATFNASFHTKRASAANFPRMGGIIP